MGCTWGQTPASVASPPPAKSSLGVEVAEPAALTGSPPGCWRSQRMWQAPVGGTGAHGSSAVWAPAAWSRAGRRAGAGPAAREPAQLCACGGPRPPPASSAFLHPPNPGPSPQPRPPSGSSAPTKTGVPWLRGSVFSGLSLLTCSTHVNAAAVRGPEKPHEGSGRGGLLGEPGGIREAMVSGVRRIWVHTAARSLKTFPECNLWPGPSDSTVTKTRPGSEVRSAAGPA